ncbi:potassium transporter TrkG [Parvularcula sp. LCG005]|uniref:potassium transporter TrkG n=1 Tax=Parvularcula sp. LCG005 TaxID=3078805 RepID=UPI0029435F92|nr:potassium transporter TrkG [Parvularcula sp. LCG005]WOI52347.1 potassium transporter TrkG [Parvularcula sp. LCG005]
MNFAPVLRFIAYSHFGIAVAMLWPALLAGTSGSASFSGYLLGAMGASMVGTLSLAISTGMRSVAPVRSGLRELLLALLFFWAVLPVTAAIPFLFEGMRFGEAWFEAVSAITTTGAWLSEPLARATDHDMLYRASLQWIGGLVSVSTAAAVFIRPEFIGIAPLVPPFARGEEGSYLRAFARAIRSFAPIYGAIAAFGALALMLLGISVIEAMTMAMSFLASGGFVPHPQGIAAYDVPSRLVAMILMILGAVNFVVIAYRVLGRGTGIRNGRDPETRTFLILIPVIAVIFWLSRGAGDIDRLLAQAFNAVSSLSTNGITLGRPPALIPILVTSVIGGAAVSTAGGIKLLRWLLTFQRTGEELWRLTHPGAVSGRSPSTNEFGVWIHALAFAVLLAILVLATAFFGYSLETSATAAVAVISNSGPLLTLAPLMTGDYLIFEPGLRTAFGVGMIAGRLELIVLLVVVNRRFWQG